MTRERRFTVGRLVFGILWLLLTGGCTGFFTLQGDGEFAGAVNGIALWVGSACIAPAIWLISTALRDLSGRWPAAWSVSAAACIVLLVGVLILVRSTDHRTELGDLLLGAAFILAPGALYGLWAGILIRAARRKTSTTGEVFE